MRRRYLIGGIAAAAVLVGGGIGVEAAVANGGGLGGSVYGAGSMSGTATPSAGGLGSAALKPGTALVDGAGRTLYLFEADTSSKSACTDACAQVWPPLLMHGASTAAAAPLQGGLVGSVTRADGTRQVTYNGHPLYYYIADKKPGESSGQGLTQFGAGWYVVAPGGNKIDDGG